MNSIKIELNRKRIGFLYFLSLGTSLFCWYILSSTSDEFTTFDKMMSVIGLLFFGGGSFFLLAHLMSKDLGLKIDDEGLTINLPFLKIGLIPWSEINGSKVIHILGNEILIIILKNPDKYLQSNKFPLAKILYKTTFSDTPDGIHISADKLSMSMEQIIQLIEIKLEIKKNNLPSKKTSIATTNNSPMGASFSTKKCPFCAEEIKFEAIKCKFCREILKPL